MGCDIHSRAEVLKNNKWEAVGKVFKSPYYDMDRPSTVDEDGYERNAEFTNEPYGGRNYDLFAILADVRNGRGFAGCKTGEGFNPISNPKGLPSDVSAEVQAQSDDWGYDGHSHSFFTVQELLDYDWHQLTMKQGVISLDQYKELKEKGGSPNGWSGGVGGINIETVDEDVADKILSGEIMTTKNIYVTYRWSIKYSDHCGYFIKDTIPSLQKLGDSDNVRIVFWFDN